jgi:hypothetical protein
MCDTQIIGTYHFPGEHTFTEDCLEIDEDFVYGRVKKKVTQGGVMRNGKLVLKVGKRHEG